MINKIKEELKAAGDSEKAVFFTRFFKTGEGEYGFGDVFYGISVPVLRKIAAKYKAISLNDIEQLLLSEVHEERLIAVFILVLQFQKADKKTRKEIYDFYLAHTKYINNWDIVDSSADRIVGEYLFSMDGIAPYGHTAASSTTPRNDVLKRLAHSDDLWERRIAIMATFAFIKHGQSEMTFVIADILLLDKHDLIHKAVGWMLREVGKRVSRESEEAFLKTRYKTMPRTMLRYAIEHFSTEKRKKYLLGEI